MGLLFGGRGEQREWRDMSFYCSLLIGNTWTTQQQKRTSPQQAWRGVQETQSRKVSPEGQQREPWVMDSIENNCLCYVDNEVMVM